jgi:2-haloacid dehalogenase
VSSALALPPQQLIFVDDRRPNVDAAHALGWGAVHFKGAAQLEDELRARGLDF